MRIHHKRKSDKVKDDHKKKSDGLSVDHEIDGWGESSPLQRAMGCVHHEKDRWGESSP